MCVCMHAGGDSVYVSMQEDVLGVCMHAEGSNECMYVCVCVRMHAGEPHLKSTTTSINEINN